MLGAWSSAEWNPPLYLIIAWPWAQVFGTGRGRPEVAVGAAGDRAGAAAVPRAVASSSRGGPGWWRPRLAAVNPFMIWYSQEAREYMLLCCCAAARCCSSPAPGSTRPAGSLMWWAVLSALALLTQYFAGFLVAAARDCSSTAPVPGRGDRAGGAGPGAGAADPARDPAVQARRCSSPASRWASACSRSRSRSA